MLGRLFSRPKWQHRNPRIRLDGVRELPEGDSRLADIARSDSDEAVRRQAVRQLIDITLLKEMSDGDGNVQVRQAAHRRLCRLLCAEDPSALNPAERTAAARTLSDPESLAYLLVHADLAAIRRHALESVDRPSTLADVALKDASVEVRLAALERLDQPSALERVAKQARGSDKRVARQAREKLAELEAKAQRPQRQLELCESLERLAGGGAPDIARYRQLEQAWDEVREDAPPELAARVAGAKSAFEQTYAEHQAATEHLARQRELCNRAESLLTEVSAAAEGDGDVRPLHQAFDFLESAWQTLVGEGELNTGCEARFLEAMQPARERLSRLDSDRALHGKLRALVEEMQKLADGPALPSQRAVKKTESRWQEILGAHRGLRLDSLVPPFKAALGRATARIQEARGREKILAEEFDQLIGDLEKALTGGELQHAISAHDKARDRLSKLQAIGTPHADSRARRLRRLEARLGELRDWRRYGLEQVRGELVQRMQALSGDKAAPNKLASKIRALQEEWRSLDRVNGPAPEALWQAFNTASEQAFEPCRTHFAAQEAEREINAKEREVFCTDLEAAYHLVDWEVPDWHAIDRQLHDARKRWRSMGGVDPDTWRRLNDRFHAVLKRFEEKLEPERKREKVRREQVIAKLETLADEQDLRRAVAAVKEAQAEWAPTVPMPQRAEQALWRRFKAASDAVFSRLDAQRAEQKQAQAEQVAAREALCESLEALASTLPASPEETQSRLEALRQAWKEAQEAPSRVRAALEKRFAEAQKRIEHAQRDAAEAERQKQEGLWRERAVLCGRLEDHLVTDGEEADAKAMADAWAALEPLADVELGERFETRYRRVSEALTGDAEVRESLLDSMPDILAEKQRLCLELELLAGVESPPQFAEARLALQVQRLPAAMMGGTRQETTAEQRDSLLTHWFLAGPVAATERAALDARFERALQAIRRPDASKKA